MFSFAVIRTLFVLWNLEFEVLEASILEGEELALLFVLFNGEMHLEVGYGEIRLSLFPDKNFAKVSCYMTNSAKDSQDLLF